MKVTESFLIGTYEENREVVGLPLFEVVERENFGDIFLVDEAVDLAVAIASDVSENGTVAGFFIEPVDRHNRENLIDRP